MSYQSVALLVTTHCDRRCPHCCYRIPTHATLPAAHYDWAYFETAARWLGGLAALYVSGGEPTLHPEFPRIAREFRALFKPRKLILATNGAGVVRHGAVMDRFDEVRVTQFGAPADQAATAWLQTYQPRRLRTHGGDHLPLSTRRGGRPCKRREIAAYADGRLWPCCVAPGIPDAATLDPCMDWRVALARLPLACKSCVFAEAL